MVYYPVRLVYFTDTDLLKYVQIGLQYLVFRRLTEKKWAKSSLKTSERGRAEKLGNDFVSLSIQAAQTVSKSTVGINYIHLWSPNIYVMTFSFCFLSALRCASSSHDASESLISGDTLMPRLNQFIPALHHALFKSRANPPPELSAGVERQAREYLIGLNNGKVRTSFYIVTPRFLLAFCLLCYVVSHSTPR